MCLYPKKSPSSGDFSEVLSLNQFFLFSHCWFATPQEVLQADWQEVWHSPQPPLLTVFAMSLVSIVLILLIL
jgi:hypothetical protein